MPLLLIILNLKLPIRRSKKLFSYSSAEQRAVIFFSLWWASLVCAKNHLPTPNDEINPFDHRQVRTYYPTDLYLTQNPETLVHEFLSNKIEGYPGGKAKFILEYYRESLGGKHYLFQQQFNGIPIYNAYLKMNVTKAGRVYSIYDNTYLAMEWDSSRLLHSVAKLINSQTDSFFEDITARHREITVKEINYAVLDGEVRAVWKYRLRGPSPDFYREYLIDEAGQIRLSIDLNVYRNKATADAYVFMPDPLTRARRYYSPPYVNYENGYNPSLDSQRVYAIIDITESSGLYLLENDVVILRDIDAPYVPVVQAVEPVFFFDRSQSGFEDVNVIYHITTFQRYVQSLGFSLPGYQIQADPHAMNGADNSYFSPGLFPPGLLFGTGGVEDAEDADVIVHEYVHVLSHAANNSNIGDERRALDEGWGDYFAASYSRAIDTFRWGDVFTWDGHNEYWPGRSAVTQKRYPDDLSMSIHANGEIWSAASMRIWNEIGREITDKLMLQTLYALAPNMRMIDAAREVIMADSLLFGGAHFCPIYFSFLRHGLMDTINDRRCSGRDKNLPVDAGEDIAVCAGDSAVIGSDNYLPSDEYTYQWIPATGLADASKPKTKVSVLQTTTYTLQIQAPDGRYNLDTVQVSLLPCGITLYNTLGFAEGVGALKIYVPPPYFDYQLSLYDAAGKRVLHRGRLSEAVTYLPSDMWSAGIYFLWVIPSHAPPRVFRLLKK